METQTTHQHHQASSVSSVAASSPSAAAQSLEQQRRELQTSMAAAQWHKTVVATTSHTIDRLLNTGAESSALYQIDWSLVDINLTLTDGRRLHSALAARLREIFHDFGRWGYLNEKERLSMAAVPDARVQQRIIDKLLEYAPIASSLQASQPRDADELLQWMAIEIAPSCCSALLPFFELLIETLHKRNFDFDRRDAAGRTLLTAYAAADDPTAAEAAGELMRLGASDFVVDSKKRCSALHIWIERGRADVLASLLVGTGPFAFLKQSVDIWQRDANGRTLKQCLQSDPYRAQLFGASITVLSELQRHWVECERPLLQRALTMDTPLISDLVAMAIDFIDGGAGSGAK